MLQLYRGDILRQEGAPNSADCIFCPKGRWSDNIGASEPTDCINCDAGRYSTSPGGKSEDSCALCHRGQFSQVAGASKLDVCTRARQGFTSPRRVCVLPPYIPGRFGNASNMTECLKCGIVK